MSFSRIPQLLRFGATIAAAAAACLLALTLAPAAQPEATSSEIRTILSAGTLPGGSVIDIAPLRAFYQQRSYRPAWSGSLRARSDARQMSTAFEHAAEEGLEPTDYRVAALRLCTQSLPAGAAECDVLLTDAGLRFERDLRTGRSLLKSVDHDLDLPTQSFDPVASLNGAIESDGISAFLTNLPPPHRQYAEDIYGRDQRMIAAIENRAANERVTMNTIDCTPA